MKKQFTIRAFEDDNGMEGWQVANLQGVFNNGLDACTDGRLLAHDLLEHNHNSKLKGIANELEAIGAAYFVRSDFEPIDLQYDVLDMARSVAWYPIAAPEHLNKSNEFQHFVEQAASSLSSELNLEEMSTEERKEISNYLRYASSYMQQGYDWAQEYYEGYCAASMCMAIRDSFITHDYIGQEYKITIDLESWEVIWEDLIDLEEVA